MRTLTTFADAQERVRHEENARIAQSNRVLRQELRDAQAQLEHIKRKLGIYERLAAEHTHPPVWDVPTRSTEHRGVPILMLSDLHWGSVVRPEEINGINAYDVRIATMRLKRTFGGTIKLARDYFANLKYDGIQVMLPGDNFSGEIHDELRETNEEAVIDSVFGLGDALIAGFQLLTKEFGTVRVVGVVGNHGRKTKKPRAKLRVTDNYDYLLYRLLARDLAKIPNIHMTVPLSPDVRLRVHRTRYLLTHGDQFKGGSGISAELAPLLLGVHRKKRRDDAVGKPFDIMCMGHFHRTLMLPHNGLIVSGSIMGYDEFAFQQNFMPEPPMSAFWVNTPEHGATFLAPVHAAKRREEGW